MTTEWRKAPVAGLGRTPLYVTDDFYAFAASITSPPVGSTSKLSEWRARRAERAGR